MAEPKKTSPKARAAKDEAAETAAEVKAAVAAEQADEAAEASAEQAKEAETEAETEAEAEKPAPKRRTRKKADADPVEEPKATKTRDRQPGERPVVRAQAKYVRTSARKARLVCDHIRGKSVTEARAILAHTPRAVAEDWQKLLESAVANAEHNHELIGDELRISSVTADEGPTLKRFRPRAMGRASKIRKRTSHLTITLTPKE